MSAASASLGEFRSAAATDTGLLRDHNEDRYWIDAERGVFLVVDGVGGHAAGELAAQTAVETIRELLIGADVRASIRTVAGSLPPRPSNASAPPSPPPITAFSKPPRMMSNTRAWPACSPWQ